MALKDFMRLKGKNVLINGVSLPDKSFMKARMIVDLVEYEVMGVDERDSGNPDVEVYPYIGEPFNITREQLAKGYVNLAYQKISVTRLKNDRRYKALTRTDLPIYFMVIPKNSIVFLGDRRAGAESVLVAPCLEDGSIDREAMCFLDSRVFRKMCVVPMNPVIKRNRVKKSPVTRILQIKMNLIKPEKPKKQVLPYYVEDRGQAGQVNQEVFNDPVVPMSRNKVKYPELSGYKYEAVARLVDAGGRLVGFVLRDLKNGKLGKLNMHNVMQACGRKEVSNLEVVVNTVKTGEKKTFIRGNGIRIDQLPAKRV